MRISVRRDSIKAELIGEEKEYIRSHALTSFFFNYIIYGTPCQQIHE
jgi:hypothetical protein